MNLDPDVVLAAAKAQTLCAIHREFPFDGRAIVRDQWVPTLQAAGWPTVEAMSAPGTCVPAPWLRGLAAALGVAESVFLVADDFG